MPDTAILLDRYYERHVPAAGHPESPARYGAVMRALKDLGDAPRIERRPATRDELLRCHSGTYLDCAETDIQNGEQNLRTGDTAVCRASFEVAREAAGGVLNAVDAVVAGRARTAFCAVRPPGHHATRHRGMGFCVLNNAALAAAHARSAHGSERVLIVDWDVHHGNGTQDIFYHDPSVMFFSTHQSPWYPGSGSARECGDGAGSGTTLNCPLAAGAARDEVLGAMDQVLRPAARDFRPDLVVISAGFDGRAGDPLGGFRLTDHDFAEMTNLVLEIADRAAGGRVVSVLEGGYDPRGLETAVAAHVTTLAGLRHRTVTA